MTIVESVTIDADIESAWDAFTDLAYWGEWNRVMSKVSAGGGGSVLREGLVFSFCIRPFVIPLHFTPVVEEVSMGEKVVWSAGKLGIRARHEFLFEKAGPAVRLTSRETFSGAVIRAFGFLIPQGRLESITKRMLREFKGQVEAATAG